MLRAAVPSALMALLLATGSGAAERVVATLADPAGDDRGDGTLIYPSRGDFQPGDLDLTTLRIVAITDEGGAYRIEAGFRNPVRNPGSIAGDVGAEALAEFARRGFYQFNLDLYFDLDRVRGSGQTATLPGRRARIDPAHAWERAVVLTPRPELMRQQLIDALADARNDADGERAQREVDAAVFFPTRVRVQGRSISFTVPAAFLAGGRADSDWSVVALVTGAKTRIEAELRLGAMLGAPATDTPLDRATLGAMQPEGGRPRDSFGYSSRTRPLPVVDALAAPGARLAVEAELAGATWSAAGAAGAAGSAVPAARLFGLPAVAPAQAPVATPAAPVLPAAAPAVTAPAAATAAQPATPAAVPPPAPRPAPPPAAVPAPKPAVAERLRQLKQLLDDKLIDEAEYRQQRQRILNEL